MKAAIILGLGLVFLGIVPQGAAGAQDYTTIQGILPVKITDVAIGAVTSTGATIGWITNAPSSSRVYYSTSPHPRDPALYLPGPLDAMQVVRHSVTLSGLSPSTRYYFRVESGIGGVMTVSDEEMSFLTPDVYRGGMGGGGSGSPGLPAVGPGVTSLLAYTDADGLFKIAAEARSQDGMATITIPKGTVAHTAEGKPLQSLAILPVTESLLSPRDGRLVGTPYDFGPNGAVFEPPGLLSIRYSPDWLPEDFKEERLVIGVWNPTVGSWSTIDGCGVDEEAKTVSALTTHFSVYALLACYRPASITVGQLQLSPDRVLPGQSVRIKAIATNTGDLPGQCDLSLKINGVVQSSRTITVEGESDVAVVFDNTQAAPGKYEVEVGGLKSAFLVAPPPSQEWSVEWLTASHSPVEQGESVLFMAVVRNADNATSSATLTLSINGSAVSEKTVILPPLASQDIEFEWVASEPGSFSAEAGGKTALVRVLEPSGVYQERKNTWRTIGATAAGTVVLAVAGGFAFAIIRRARSGKRR